MRKKKEQFVKCGLEFTAAKRPDTYLDESLFSNKMNPKSTGSYHSRPYLGENGKPLPLNMRYSESELANFSKEQIQNLEERDADYIKINFTRINTQLKPEHKEEDSSIHFRWDYKDSLAPYHWISQKANSDSCGTEIATPIITSREEIRQYYLEFMAFVRLHNLTTNLDEAICGLGGCHIHFSVVQFTEVEKHFFLKNMAIFMTNYPELNWGFNDVNDNENANSLLNPSVYSVFGSLFHGTPEGEDKRQEVIKALDVRERREGMTVEIRRDEDGRFYHKILDTPKDSHADGPSGHIKSKAFSTESSRDKRDKKEKEKGAIRYKYRKDKSIFRAFINHPIEISLSKQYCFRYNANYNTVEFRIFDMPDSLDRLMLHYDVAMAIYSLCAEYAKSNKVLKHTYKKYEYDLDKSIKRFDDCLEFLGVDPARAEVMRDNIRTRYYWNETQTEKNYLL